MSWNRGAAAHTGAMRIAVLAGLGAGLLLAACAGAPASPWDVDGDGIVRLTILGVLVALGTNDLMAGGAPAAVAKVIAFAVRRLGASGARLLVAHVPPCRNRRCSPNAVHELNATLAVMLPAVAKVDFWTGVTPADMQPDGLHVTAASHTKWRDTALRVLREGPPPAEVHGGGRPKLQVWISSMKV